MVGDRWLPLSRRMVPSEENPFDKEDDDVYVHADTVKAKEYKSMARRIRRPERGTDR